MGEWIEYGPGLLAILPYDTVRTANDPRATVLAFCQSAYEAGARLADWDAGSFESNWCPTRINSRASRQPRPPTWAVRDLIHAADRSPRRVRVSPRVSSATGASFRSTATGCSARSRTPRTSSRRPSCARGAGARASAPTGAARSGHGSTGSRRTRASTCFAAGRAGWCRRRWRRRGTRPCRLRPRLDLPWLQPYPDRLLEPIAAAEEEPGAVVVARETIELAFIAAIQHLPPRQRAVLILRDVLGWSAKDSGVAARRERRLGEQRAAAGAGDAPGAPARAADGVGAVLGAERGGARAAAALRGRPRARRRRRARRAAARGRAPDDASAPDLVRGARGDRDRLAAGLRSRVRPPARRASTGANTQPAAAHYLRAPGETELPAAGARRAPDRGRARSPRSPRSSPRSCSRRSASRRRSDR